jgi:hypothetical protein
MSRGRLYNWLQSFPPRGRVLSLRSFLAEGVLIMPCVKRLVCHRPKLRINNIYNNEKEDMLKS